GGPQVQFEHCERGRRLANLGCTATANARRPVEVLSTRKRESPPPRSAIADGFRFADRSRPGSRRRRLLGPGRCCSLLQLTANRFEIIGDCENRTPLEWQQRAAGGDR